MKLIDQSDYVALREELNEYMVLCNQYKHTPSKQEFDEIVKFLLLYQTGVGHMCESVANEFSPESSLSKHLYESYELDLLSEDDGWTGGDAGGKYYDPQKDFDSAVDTAKSAVKGAALGVLAVGLLIAYLLKKRKVKKSVAAEFEATQDRFKDYAKLNELKLKKWELEGKTGEIPQAVLPPVEDDEAE
jgi:hypothetical protein